MQPQFEQSAKSVEGGSTAFPWLNKTLIKTQSTVCKKLHPLSQALSDSYQPCSEPGEVTRALLRLAKLSLFKPSQYQMSSIHFAVSHEKFSVEPGTIKQQRLKNVTDCKSNPAPCVFFFFSSGRSRTLHAVLIKKKIKKK